MSGAAAADVLGARPEAAVTGLVMRAGGNPLYIAELLCSTGDAPPPGDLVRSPSSPLPASLRAAVAAHLRSLPEPSWDLLKVASVLGRQFAVSDLAAMTTQPAGLLMSPLEQALAAEMIAEAGDRLAFRHDLFRQAVCQEPFEGIGPVPLPPFAASRTKATPLVLLAGLEHCWPVVSAPSRHPVS